MRKILFSALLIGALALPFFGNAVTVGPVKLEYFTDPGKTITGELFLQNEESGTKTFYPSFEKFTEDNGQKNFTREESDLSTWFKMTSSVTLKSGESKQIPFSIKVPKNAPPGGHFAVIWWSTSPPGGGGEKVSIVTRAGILVYLTVSGDLKESGTLADFEISKRFVTSFPIELAITFKNTGNSYLRPTGEIRIKNILGMTQAVTQVNPFGSNILPQSQKNFNQSVDAKGFFFGPYRAELDLMYGASAQHITQSRWFFAAPWKISLTIILLALLVFFVIPAGIKKYNAWIIRKARG